MLPVAEEYKKILLVEPAVADSITGDKWNRYIFRTGRNSLAGRDLQRGRDRQAGRHDRDAGAGLRVRPRRREAFKEALARPAQRSSARGIRCRPTTTDFTAAGQRLFDALKDKPGRKIIWVIWAGAGNPLAKLPDMDPKRYGIELSTGGNILPAMAAYKSFPGMEGATYYYYDIPKNPVNDWLVAEHQKRSTRRRISSPPAAFAAAMAVVAAREQGEVAPTPRS